MFDTLKGWWERGRKYPSEGWVVSANEEAIHTPDILELEASPIRFLFLPCELQERLPQGSLSIQGGTPLWKGFTINKFSLFRNREDHTAVMLDEPRHRVRGEVWAMNPSHYSVLDKYKGNGLRCDRKRLDILIPYSRITDREEVVEKRTFFKMNVFAYEGRPEFWKDKLDAGYQYPAVSVFRPNNPFLNTFYYYHPSECKK